MSLSDLATRAWDDAQRHYEEELLDSIVPAAGPMLDVGCDDGSWTERVRRRAGLGVGDVHGIEIVDERRALANARGFHAIPGDIEQRWPYDDATFSLVHANQVIEHVKRLDHFASETRRVLRPDGLAVICTENLASWHNIAPLFLGYQPFSVTNISNRAALGNPFALHPDGPDDHRGESWQHIHVITLVALVQLFTAHGFLVEHTFAGGYHPFRGRFARALARRDPRHGHFIGLRARLAG